LLVLVKVVLVKVVLVQVVLVQVVLVQVVLVQVVLVQVVELVAVVLLRADLDTLSADAELVGLLLDEVDGGGGVGQLVEALVNVLQRSDDLLLLLKIV
jgi:hypothetical protein